MASSTPGIAAAAVTSKGAAGTSRRSFDITRSIDLWRKGRYKKHLDRVNVGVFTRGFVLITGATVAHTFTASLVASTMALLVVRRLDLPPYLIGITIAISAVAALIVRIPVGSGIDRYGARRFAIAGPALVACATVLF